jgi:predicted transcriptional regulator
MLDKKEKFIKEKVWTTIDPDILSRIDSIAVNERRTRPEMLRILITDQVDLILKNKKGVKHNG